MGDRVVADIVVDALLCGHPRRDEAVQGNRRPAT